MSYFLLEGNPSSVRYGLRVANQAKNRTSGRRSMSITVGEIIVWLIVGLSAGSLAAMLVTRRKKGFGYLTNLVIGLVGAAIGGFLFRFLNISLGLGSLAVSIDQVVSAFAGSLVFIILVSFVRWRR